MNVADAAEDRGFAELVEIEPRHATLNAELDVPGAHLRIAGSGEDAACFVLESSLSEKLKVPITKRPVGLCLIEAEPAQS